MIKITELFKRTSANGKSFYSGRLGEGYLLLVKNEEKQDLFSGDLFIYLSNQDQLQETFHDEF